MSDQNKKKKGRVENLIPFKKGQSGNPAGRPKQLPKLDNLIEEVLGEEKDGVKAIEAILKALRAKAAKGDIRAAELLLDRAYGKSKQAVEISVKKLGMDLENENYNG